MADPNLLNIADIAQRSNSAVDLKIAYSLYNSDSVWKDILWKTKKSLEYKGTRVTRGDQLPAMNWVDIDEDPQYVKGSTTPYTEKAFIIRNNIGSDRILTELDDLDSNPIEETFEMWKMGMVCDTNDVFFNGSVQRNDKEIPGLKWRVANGLIAQDMMVDANANISSSATKADSINFLAKLRLIASNAGTDGLKGWTIYCDAQGEIGLWTAVANAGPGAGFKTDEDAFGRKVDTILGAKVRVVGRRRDQVTRIIPVDEDAFGKSATVDTATVPGGGAGGAQTLNRTSFWLVRHEEGYFTGWQGAPLRLYPAGTNDTAIRNNWLIQWYGGYRTQNIRSVGRLYNCRLV